MPIQSNLIIQTEIPLAKKDGFRDVLLTLNQIEERLTRLSGKNIVVNIETRISDQARRDIQALQNQAARTQALVTSPVGVAAGGGGAGGGIIGGTGGGFNQGRLPPGADTVLEKTFKGGTDEAIKTVQATERINQGVKETITLTERLNKDGEASLTIREKQVNLIEQANQREALSAARAAEKRKQNFTEALQNFKQLRQQGFTLDRTRSSDKDGTPQIRTLTKAYNDLENVVQKVNFASGETTKHIERNQSGFRQQAQNVTAAQGAAAALANRTKLLNDGFTEGARRVKEFADGTKEVVTEFRRASGSRFAQTLKLDIAELNEKTGTLSQRQLEGSVAARRLGDSFASAAGKVTLWVGATTAIYGSIRTIKAAVDITAQLEKNTIFLSRVGRNIKGSFADQTEAAEHLTRELVKLSAVFGANALDAQRAAGVFARQGLNQKEILDAVTASILASRIAELDLIEASELLASALAQFNLQASQLLPTLNSLNELSNNYRVTTDDLLQSISRTGAVFADQNSTIEQLAATTAVLVQNTARSGTQIGNALKTIVSRLSGVEISRKLFEETGISVRDLAGEGKNLTQILIELESAFTTLNKAQRDDLTINIAGVRQRNILIQAINNVTDIAIAEAVAVRGTGSAFQEAKLESTTLTAALDRLKAVFVEVISTQGLQDSLKGILALLSGILKLIGAFDGLLLKAALFVAATTLVRIALNKITASALISGKAVTAAGTSIAATSAISRIAVSSMDVLAASMTKLNLVAAVVTGTLFVLITELGSAERNAAAAAAAQRVLTEEQNNAAESAKKQTAATEQLVNILGIKLNRLRELDEQEKAGKNILEERKKVEEDIQKIRERGLKDTSQIPNLKTETGREKTLEQGIEAVRNIRKSEIVEQEKSIKQNQKQIELIKQQIVQLEQVDGLVKGIQQGTPANPISGLNISLLRSQIRQIGKELEISGLKEADEPGFISFLTGKPFTRLTQGEEAKIQLAAQAKISELNNELNKLEVQTNLTADALDNLKTKEGFSNTVEANAKKAQLAFEGLRLEIEGTTAGFDKTRKLADIFGLDETDILNQELEATENQLEALIEQLNAIGIFGETEKVKEIAEQIGLLQERADELSTDLVKVNSNLLKTFTTDSLKRSIDLFKSFRTENNKLQRELSGKSKLTEGLDQAVLEQELILESIEKITNSLNKQDLIPVNAAKRAQVAELENQLAENQIDLAKQLLSTETEIAIQRKKAADEAARALGTLSEEDKLRVRAQAAFFAKNPNARVSVEQQFAGSAESNRIAQQFFGAKLDTNLTDSPFGKQLAAAGFGIPADIIKGQEEAARIRQNIFGGLSAEQIIQEASNRAAEAAAQALGGSEVVSQIGIEIAEQIGSAFSDLRPILNVNINNALANNIAPLVDAFERAVNEQQQSTINEIIARVDASLKSSRELRIPITLPRP